MTKEGEHAVASDVAERGQFEGIVAAVEGQGTGMGIVAAEGGQHLLGQSGEEGRVVFAVDHKGVFAGTQATLDVGHRANGRPVFAELVYGDMVAKGFPDVGGRHALADDVGKVGGDVEEAASTHDGIVNQSDVADGRADAGAENAEAGKTLLLEPPDAAASVLDGLAIGLEGDADVGADELVSALMAFSHAAVVVGEAHFQGSDADALEPFA